MPTLTLSDADAAALREALRDAAATGTPVRVVSRGGTDFTFLTAAPPPRRTGGGAGDLGGEGEDDRVVYPSGVSERAVDGLLEYYTQNPPDPAGEWPWPTWREDLESLRTRPPGRSLTAIVADLRSRTAGGADAGGTDGGE